MDFLFPPSTWSYMNWVHAEYVKRPIKEAGAESHQRVWHPLAVTNLGSTFSYHISGDDRCARDAEQTEGGSHKPQNKRYWCVVWLYYISFLMCWKPFPTKQVKHNGAHKHMLKVHELIHESKKAKTTKKKRKKQGSIADINHTIKKHNTKTIKPHNIIKCL